MSENCSGQCSSCGESCSSRQAESLLAQANPLSSVKKVIGIVSGKGGVGKSTVTSMLAVAHEPAGPADRRCWMRTLRGRPFPRHSALIPARAWRMTPDGKLMILGASPETGSGDHERRTCCWSTRRIPVIWSAPGDLAGAVKQFWTRRRCGRMSTICLWICLPEPATCL